MHCGWTNDYPDPKVLRQEVAAMVDTIVAVLRARVPSLRGLYLKGSAQKQWDSPVDYVPEMSDVDIHLLLDEAEGATEAPAEMDAALAIQAELEEEYGRRVPRPIHTPRPQFVNLNQLLKDPRYSPTPEAVVQRLWGDPYPDAHWDEQHERVLARDRLMDQADTPAWLKLRVLDRPGVYLLPVLRDLNWRVSPVAPRVLLLKRLPCGDVWSWNRTQLVAQLLEAGETELARHYREFYLSAWQYFLSGYRDSAAARQAVRAGTCVLEMSVAVAQQWREPPGN